MSIEWNLWHGCHKISEGCRHCYVYRRDESCERDASQVFKTQKFDLPIQKNRKGEYKIKSGEVIATCFTSDFLLEEADEWRQEAWNMIRQRSDVHFFFITKRIDRFDKCVPPDWGDGWDNVTVGCTCENQKMADYRLPIFIKSKIKHKYIINSPLLEVIDMRKYLASGKISKVTVGGESGLEARVCDYDWVLDIRKQCLEYGVPFWYYQTGARLRKNGKIYRIPRKFQHEQARKSGLNTEIKKPVLAKGQIEMDL